MINLTAEEFETSQKIADLKRSSGTHSPSIQTIAEKLPELDIKVDACFLSNPYATDLFMNHLEEDLIKTGKFRQTLEFYPSQNEVIANKLSQSLDVCPSNLFVGNGAIEVIQAVLHNFSKNKMLVNIPTFSSYYEFKRDDVEVIYYQLKKETDYLLDAEKYISFVKENNPDTIVIINPNNPNGGYLSLEKLEYIIRSLQEVETIVIDESFIHFAYESNEHELLSVNSLFKKYSNVVVVKSMSKDFGVAGIRVGYGVMNKERVSKLVSNGYLWNSNGLAEYFLNLYSSRDFMAEYEVVRKNYIEKTKLFFSSLSQVEFLKVYPSMANFALVELLDGSSCNDFVSKLLIRDGVYTRTGSDKIGLDGEFVRVAARSEEENSVILSAIKRIHE